MRTDLTCAVFLPPHSDRLHLLCADGRIAALPGDDALMPASTQPQSKSAEPGVAVGRVANVRGWLAVPVHQGRSVLAVRVSPDATIAQRLVLPTLEGLRLSCCVVHEDALVMAVARELQPSVNLEESEPMLALWDLRKAKASPSRDPQTIRSSALPIRSSEMRKQIDDLAVIGEDLVALDNVIVPKFLLRFERAALPEGLEFIDAVSFVNGTWERARQVVGGNGWAAVLSTTVGELGSAEHLTIWSLPYWRHVATVSQFDRWNFGSAFEPKAKWVRIAALCSLLIVESERGDVGLVHVPTLITQWRAKNSDVRPGGGQTALKVDAAAGIVWTNTVRGHVVALPERRVVVFMRDVVESGRIASSSASGSAGCALTEVELASASTEWVEQITQARARWREARAKEMGFYVEDISQEVWTLLEKLQ